MDDALLLTSSHREPPPGSRVRDPLGRIWTRWDDPDSDWRPDRRWYPEPNEGDVESWAKLAGDLGPVEWLTDL